MATLNITLPEGAILCDGKQITFRAPCDCTGVTAIVIDGVSYDLLNTANESVSTSRSFMAGTLVSVLIDMQNNRAYIQNAASSTAPITPEDLNVYDKNDTLTDSIKLIYGMDATAVPDDIFEFLGKYNLHWWRWRAEQTGFYEHQGTPQTVIVGGCDYYYEDDSQSGSTIRYSSSINISSDGAISLVSSKLVTLDYFNTDCINVLKGKYFQKAYGGDNTIYKSASNSSVQTKVEYYEDEGYDTIDYSLTNVSEVTASYVKDVGDWVYANLTDRNAYPDNETVDGVKYEYLGVPFEKLLTAGRIEYGSYMGSGTYGSTTPNRLTFSFAPKVVLLFGGGNFGILFPLGGVGGSQTFVYSSYSHGCSFSSVTLSDTTVAWYCASNDSGAGAYGQMNTSTYTYHYIAIG